MEEFLYNETSKRNFYFQLEECEERKCLKVKIKRVLIQIHLGPTGLNEGKAVLIVFQNENICHNEQLVIDFQSRQGNFLQTTS